ncbi:MAG: hypothetical protein MUE85_15305 [Microscillaceae bacterium]|jgi:hypothetical protein|nr:hypothetical protein [Microscillaceae bacterium]
MSINYRFFCLYFIFNIANLATTYAQKTWYLRPSFGFHNPYSQVEISERGIDAFAKKNNVRGRLNLGLLLDRQFNPKITLTSGLMVSIDDWNFTLTFPDDLVINPPLRPNLVGQSAVFATLRLPLLVNHTIWQLKPKDKSSQMFLPALDGKIIGIFGLIYNQIIAKNEPAFTNWNVPFRWNLPDNNTIDAVVSPNQRANLNLVLGLGFQLLVKQSPSLRLDIFYSQGFSQLLDLKVEYRFNNSVFYQSQAKNQGNALFFRFSYPIRISRIN